MEEGGTELRDWSALPNPAVLLIAQHLRTLADCYALAGVCTGWHSVFGLVLREFMAGPLVFNGDVLALYRPRDEYGEWFPTTMPLGHRRGQPRVIGVSQGYFVLEAYGTRRLQGPRLRFVNTLTGDKLREDVPPLPAGDILWAAFTAPPSSPACMAVAYHVVDFRRAILFCRPGDTHWSKARNTDRLFSSLVTVRGSVCAWNIWDLELLVCFFPSHCFGGPYITRVKASEEMLPILWPAPLLASSCGQLWMVVHEVPAEYNSPPRGRVAVYQLEFCRKVWTRLGSLGRRALLLSTQNCVVSQDPARWGGEENCVYIVHNPRYPQVYTFPYAEEEEEEEEEEEQRQQEEEEEDFVGIPPAAVPYTRPGTRAPFWMVPNP